MRDPEVWKPRYTRRGSRVLVNFATVAMLLFALACIVSALYGLFAPPAHGAESDVYWQCKTTNPVGWCPTSASNPLPVTSSGISPLVGTFTDESGSVTLGGTSQTLAAANTSRKRIIIQNPLDATGQGIATAENLCINFTSAASASAGSSFCLLPGGSYDSEAGPVTSELITVVAATTGHKWAAKEQ